LLINVNQNRNKKLNYVIKKKFKKKKQAWIFKHVKGAEIAKREKNLFSKN